MMKDLLKKYSGTPIGFLEGIAIKLPIAISEDSRGQHIHGANNPLANQNEARLVAKPQSLPCNCPTKVHVAVES